MLPLWMVMIHGMPVTALIAMVIILLFEQKMMSGFVQVALVNLNRLKAVAGVMS